VLGGSTFLGFGEVWDENLLVLEHAGHRVQAHTAVVDERVEHRDGPTGVGRLEPRTHSINEHN
jgi:hypothetical protein